MKFAVMGRILDYEGFGVQTLLVGFLRGILTCSSEHEIVLMVPGQIPEHYFSEFVDRCTIVRLGGAAKGSFSKFSWDHLLVPMACWRHRIDALLAPAHVSPFIRNVPAVVCVPDMMYHLFPHWWPSQEKSYIKTSQLVSTRKAEAIVAISESTRRDIINVLDIPTERVHLVEPGVPETFSVTASANDSNILKSRGLSGPYLIATASSHPRKNLPVLLRAFEEIEDDIPHDLVLFGPVHESFRAQLDAASSRVRNLGLVPREELPALLRNSSAFLFPSLYEGFGLPLIEAMACGCPVIGANSSSIAEIVSGTGVLFEPDSSEDLAAKLKQVITEPRTLTALKNQSLLKAANYSWQRSGKKLIQLLEIAARSQR